MSGLSSETFSTVFMSRGVVQISAFVDAVLASFLPEGSVVALTYAQSLYTLPVSFVWHVSVGSRTAGDVQSNRQH